MTTDIAATSPIAFAPRRCRRPTTLDRVRVRELIQRMEAGEPEVEAFWTVASDPRIGFSRLRGSTARPSEIVLRRKLAALLERTAPDLLAMARDRAVAQLSGLGDDAVCAVREVLTGDFSDDGHARARLGAAEVVLRSLGLAERSGGATVQTAVQVNVHGGEYALAEEIERDPESRRLALDLSRRLAAGPGGLRHDADARPLDDGAAPGPGVTPDRGGGETG